MPRVNPHKRKLCPLTNNACPTTDPPTNSTFVQWVPPVKVNGAGYPILIQGFKTGLRAVSLARSRPSLTKFHQVRVPRTSFVFYVEWRLTWCPAPSFNVSSQHCSSHQLFEPRQRSIRIDWLLFYMFWNIQLLGRKQKVNALSSSSCMVFEGTFFDILEPILDVIYYYDTNGVSCIAH